MNMQWHDFIFSEQRRHRLARHIAFWLVWCLAYNILFHLPTHLFKGWDPVVPEQKIPAGIRDPLFFLSNHSSLIHFLE